jgi:type IV pilus assembly protein PilY1
VTDQATPNLLWEFSYADRGVTNVGPAIVKVGGKEKRCAISNNVCTSDTDCGVIATNGKCVTSVDTNGRWFAILASGSTGPISTSNKEFKGTSDKSLKLFVLDLKTGALLRTIDTGVAPTNLGITNAFAGSISTSALDLEKDRPGESGNYQDDAVYIGYVKDTTNGGVLRLVINDDVNPANWTVSKVIDGIGPVTTSVVNLLDRKDGKLWLYFAEGRYFFQAG